jgi:hypothetical protein
MTDPGTIEGHERAVSAQPVAVDRRISPGVFVFIVAVILAGFAKNFYLRAWLGTRHLIPTAWVHGFIMSAWVMLFVIQVVGVARRRVDLHRQLGVFGAVLAAAVVIVGVLTIVVRARLAYPDASPAFHGVVFVAFDGVSLILFAVLVGYALRWRARPAIHRRLMTMAMVALLPPAFGRAVAYVAHQHVEIAVLCLMLLTVLTLVAVDARRNGRIHRACLVPGLSIVVTNMATYFAQVNT